jgi:hypothetical protein
VGYCMPFRSAHCQVKDDLYDRRSSLSEDTVAYISTRTPGFQVGCDRHDQLSLSGQTLYLRAVITMVWDVSKAFVFVH